LGELTFINRLDDPVTLSRLAWEPDIPVRRDLRLFALLASTSAEDLPYGEWEWFDCEEDRCARLNIDGANALELGFFDDGVSHTLVSISTD
jgi:hypothetical protein